MLSAESLTTDADEVLVRAREVGQICCRWDPTAVERLRHLDAFADDEREPTREPGSADTVSRTRDD